MADKESKKAERENGVAEAGAKALPERCAGARIVRGEQQSQHKDEAGDARRTHQDSKNERDADSQFAIRHEKGDRRGVRQDEVSKSRGDEWIRAAFLKKFVNPKLKTAVQGELRTEYFVLAENQKESADAYAQQG